MPLNGEGSVARWWNLLLLVVRDITALRLDTVLTLLTMAIGALTLAATFFIGDGALAALWTDLDRLMGDHLIVYPESGPRNALLVRRPGPELTPADLVALRAALPDARYVEPRHFGAAAAVSQGRVNRVAVDGVTEALLGEELYRPLSGRGFGTAALSGLLCECLVTESAARLLLDGAASGAAIGLDGQRCAVQGVVPDPPETDERFRARVVVPYAYARLVWGSPGDVGAIVVGWRRPEDLEPLVSRIGAALDAARAPGAYALSSSQFTLAKRRRIVGHFMAFGAAQAFFCVLVAAIGIVNVMLAGVVRRSREFAIRVTMGARHADLALLVLAESLALGMVGAGIGVAAAALSAPALSAAIASRVAEAGALRPVIGLRGIVVPFLVCGGCALVAGIVPALRTRRLDILPFLRAE